MASETATREDFKRYLLGELSEEECVRIESSLLDDSPYEELQATEQDLIDRYVSGEMEPHEQELFEKNYLESSPERLKRVAIARGVLNVLPILAGRQPAQVESASPAVSFFDQLRALVKKYKLHPVYVLPVIVTLISALVATYVVLRSSRESAERRKVEAQLRAQLDEAALIAQVQEEEINRLREAVAAQNAHQEAVISQLRQEHDALLKREREMVADLRSRNLNNVPTLQSIQLSPYKGTAGIEDEHPPAFTIKRNRVRLRLRVPLGQTGRLPPSYTVKLNGQVIAQAVAPRRTRRRRVVELSVFSTQLVEGINRIVLEGGAEYASVPYVLVVSK